MKILLVSIKVFVIIWGGGLFEEGGYRWLAGKNVESGRKNPKPNNVGGGGGERRHYSVLKEYHMT